MSWIPGPRQVVREALMLTALPRGVAGVAWRWVRPGTPVRHVEEIGDHRDMPPPLPATLAHDQPVEAGVGPALHRRFEVCISGARTTPAAVVDALAADMNTAMVPGVARFDPVVGTGADGRPGAMEVGDELVVRMPGPWDGPVRVVDRDRTSFRLATLAGHLEAGQIEFAARRVGAPEDALIEFTVTTWARAGDRLADLLYNQLGVAKEIQYQLWVNVCTRAVEIAGGRAPEGVQVRTRRVAWPEGATRESGPAVVPESASSSALRCTPRPVREPGTAAGAAAPGTSSRPV